MYKMKYFVLFTLINEEAYIVSHKDIFRMQLAILWEKSHVSFEAIKLNELVLNSTSKSIHNALKKVKLISHWKCK